MSKRSHSREEITFDDACALLEATLTDATRKEVLTEILKSKDFGRALRQLREGIRSHVLQAGPNPLSLRRIVNKFDSQTRQDGFHVLHDWDGTAERLNEEIIPVDVLNHLLSMRSSEPPDGTALAILLDYYLMYVLALLSLRVWDQGNADENLDRVSRLLAELQGPKGSGQKFADNAETLILIATSHFEPDENAYRRLLEKVRTLNPTHRTNVALAHAAILASHLRFGFEAFYERNLTKMRDDNGPDYPALSFALATLMEAYARMHDGGVEGTERDRVVEGVLNGLTPDAAAFLVRPPPSLSAHEPERSRFCELFLQYRRDLLEEFRGHRPSEQDYSPISFFFNFSHNVLKATVVDALLRREGWALTLNDLLSGIPRGEPMSASRETLARTLMGYARSSPERIRGRSVPVILYDPGAGQKAFTRTIHEIEK